MLRAATVLLCLMQLCIAGARAEREVNPLPPPAKMRQDVLAYVESLRLKDLGTNYGVYRMEAGQRPSLYASCDAALIRYIVGDLNLSTNQRSEWIAYINSFQDPQSGKYPAQRYLHLFGTTVRALNALEGQPKFPATFQREWEELRHTQEWMAGLNWKSPWEPSIQILHVAAPRGAARLWGPSAPDTVWLSGVLDWLDQHQDPKTGLWGPDRGSSTFDGMGATFHFLPLYEAAERPIRNGPQMIDSILSIQKSKHGTWGGVYADMDAISMLVYFYLREDYRRADIQDSVRTSLELLYKTAYQSKTGAFGDLGNTLGACEHLAEAGRILTNHPYANLGWQRAWDWKLWKCKW